MNNVLRTTLIVIVILAVAGGIFFAGNMYARATAFAPGSMMFGYGWNNNNAYGYGPGMMGRGGNGYGLGMMGGNGYGPGMMGGYGYNNANVIPLTIDQARKAADAYVKNLGIEGLMVEEIMIFDNNGYALVVEESTGMGAFELLIDPVSQTAYPEHGPNIMWNLKYGGLNHQNMMGGRGSWMGRMMGGFGWGNTNPAEVSADMPVTPEKAVEYAQKYLDSNFTGTVASDNPVKFYGYYTLDFEKIGKVVGMLSVNGYNGQIFYHFWHGTFIEESEMQ